MRYIISMFRGFFYHLKGSFLSPLPIRLYMIQVLARKYQVGSFSQRLAIDAVSYPGYAYGMYSAALQAKALGINKISAIEFGVATGYGLIEMEKYAREINKELGVEFEIFGFDSGEGLPRPVDFKDQCYFWTETSFKMNIKKLQSNLKKAKLVMGDINHTIDNFFTSNTLSPIGFIAFDLDYYSSTISSFKIFNHSNERFLPRVECYMDDVCSTELLVASKETGVLKAISDFNKQDTDSKKILKKQGVSFLRRLPSAWNGKIYVFHSFNHSKYNDPVVKVQNSAEIKVGKS